jgi:hypothetical protein
MRLETTAGERLISRPAADILPVRATRAKISRSEMAVMFGTFGFAGSTIVLLLLLPFRVWSAKVCCPFSLLAYVLFRFIDKRRSCPNSLANRQARLQGLTKGN